MSEINREKDVLFASQAVEEARTSRHRDGEIPVYSGAVAVRSGELIAKAHRGEFRDGEHAEYTLLERKLSTVDVAGATVYTTLEPCTTRTSTHRSCAEQLIERRVARVVIGMLDPSPQLRGSGVLMLRGAGIEIDLFPTHLTVELETLNRAYIQKASELSHIRPRVHETRWNTTTLILGIAVAISIIVGAIWVGVQYPESQDYLAVAGGVLAVLSLASALLGYLGDDYKTATASFAEAVFLALLPPGVRLGHTRYSLESANREVERLLEDVRKLASSSTSSRSLLPEEQQAFVGKVTNEVKHDIQKQILDSIEEKYSVAMVRESQMRELRSGFERTRDRLITEVQALSRRANLNLVIGTLTTIAAVILLGYIVLNSDVTITDWKVVLPGYVLRLSLVVFIEVFAFFFLRMYRSNLTEIKYFQNEITNIEARFLALDAALAHGDGGTIGKILSILSETERNFVLKSGESTVDLERVKAENQTLKDALSSVTTIFSTRK